jgi:hypothetical protein
VTFDTPPSPLPLPLLVSAKRVLRLVESNRAICTSGKRKRSLGRQRDEKDTRYTLKLKARQRHPKLSMPEAFPPTVAEREAELVALQNAFDEYIASSRELEEELDAELAKLRKLNL